MILISVVIPNYNGRKFLEQCLNSLREQTFKNFETIVVDSGSTDDSVKYLKKNFSEVRIIKLKKNYGFAYAVNRGIEISKGKYIALLNNDTIVDSKWLEELYKAISINFEIGLCASKILYSDRKTINTAGDFIRPDGWPIQRGKGEIDIGQYDSFTDVFSACAAAAIYRKKLFKDIGLFEEKFVSLREDLDIGFRAQLAGYKCKYVPNAVVYHYGGETLKGDKFRVFLSHRNLILLLIKNMPLSLLVKYMPKILSRQLKLIYFSIKYKYFLTHLSALFSGLIMIPEMIRRRWKTQMNKKVTTKYIESLLWRKHYV